MFLKYKVIVLGAALALAYSPAVFAQSNPASGGDSANGTPGPTSGSSSGGYIQSQTPSSTGQGTTDPSVMGHGPCNAVAGKASTSPANSSATQTAGTSGGAGTTVTKGSTSGGDSANGC